MECIGSGRYLRFGGGRYARTRKVWEHAPPEKFLKLDALRSLLVHESIFVLKFIFGLDGTRLPG